MYIYMYIHLYIYMYTGPRQRACQLHHAFVARAGVCVCVCVCAKDIPRSFCSHRLAAAAADAGCLMPYALCLMPDA